MNHAAESIATLCDVLRSQADNMDTAGNWPAEQLRQCGDQGVFRWFVPPQWGHSV